MKERADNNTSAPCADGRHDRCDGVIVTPHRQLGDVSRPCACVQCAHPPVDRWQRLPRVQG